jgi:hypothetical protein
LVRAFKLSSSELSKSSGMSRKLSDGICVVMLVNKALAGSAKSFTFIWRNDQKVEALQTSTDEKYSY